MTLKPEQRMYLSWVLSIIIAGLVRRAIMRALGYTAQPEWRLRDE